MSPTSVPELERRLRAAMRPGPSDLGVAPSFADRVVTRATRSRRRRRAVYAMAVPVLVAAAAVGVIVVADEVTDSNSAPVEKPTEEPVPLDRWLENRTLGSGDPSKPASAGTSMYRSCADDCTVTLVSPSGREIDLADDRPALAQQLAERGLADASLSPTGHWLGLPTDDGAYRIYHLSTQSRPVIEVPASPDGDRWELVGWSEQSWAPTLALYDGDRIVRFANWDNLLRDRVSYLDVPEGVVTTPFLGHRNYYLSPVMDPIEPDDNGWMPRVAATTPPSNEWLIVHRLWGRYTAGKVVRDVPEWDEGQSFEDCVGPDETLAAPDGRIYQWEVRGSRSRDADSVIVSTAVFSRDPSRTEPVALVLRDCKPNPDWQGAGSAGGRLDLPTSTESEEWTFLGMLPDGEVAMLRTVDGEPTYVRLSEDGQLDPMYDLPADAQVIVPGGMTGD